MARPRRGARQWLDGVHDPAVLPANFLRYQWTSRGSFTAEKFTLQLAVRRGGELVGTQGFHTQDYTVTRTGETGSWLGRRFHRQGIGTRMRQAVCAFAFDHLGAVQVTSGLSSTTVLTRREPQGRLPGQRRAAAVAPPR